MLLTGDGGVATIGIDGAKERAGAGFEATNSALGLGESWIKPTISPGLDYFYLSLVSAE